MPDIALRLGRDILVLDGAMGTMLQKHDLPSDQSFVQLNVTAPDIVIEVHRLYNLAGADCATSNSFGGSRLKLEAYGLGDQVEELNRAAVRVARASGATHILGELGPTGHVLEPLGSARFDELFDVFAEQAAALALEHPDAIQIATMTDIAEARCAVLAARSVTDLPVFVTCTFGLNGRMDRLGHRPGGGGGDPRGRRGVRGGAELRPRPRADAAARRADGVRHHAADHRAAQRRPAAARGREDRVPGHGS